MKTRYSDEELQEFKQLVDQKLVMAKSQMSDIQKQILEVTENSDGEFGSDWIDDSTVGSQIDFLNEMALRQRKYVADLENALIRIHNKSYGICVVTGELIDKRRLMAVPTTTKSLGAKIAVPDRPREQPDKPSPLPVQEGKKIISRVIKKPNQKTVTPADAPINEDDDDFLLGNDDDDQKFMEDEDFDFDNYVDNAEEGDNDSDY
jgi:RNA polymerase-binding transcription factor DksA